MKRQRKSGPVRVGFTLIELLVVIAIIGILMTLSAAAVIRYAGTQKQNNTQTIIRKIQPAFQARWNAVIDQAKRDPIPQVVLDMSKDAAGQVDERRARVIYIKLSLRRAFPMNYSEACDPFPLRPIGAYQKEVWRATRMQVTPTAAADPLQNSACLLMALKNGPGGQVLDDGDLGAGAVTDTNGDGINEIIDGWGTPIQFIRFPYAWDGQNPGGSPQPGNNNDPVDPQGLLTHPSWAPALRAQFQGLCHPVAAAGGGAALTYRLVPVIISAGQNRRMGIDFFSGATGVPNDANDNVSNYFLLRLGDRGN